MALTIPLPIVGCGQNNFSGFQCYNRYSEVVGPDISFSRHLATLVLSALGWKTGKDDCNQITLANT